MPTDNKSSHPFYSRRTFIAKSLFGGLLGIFGIPYLSNGSTKKNTLPKPKKNTDQNFKNLSWSEIKNEFSLGKNFFHFNTASLGPSPNIVLEKIFEAMRLFAYLGTSKHNRVELTRTKIGKFLNADNELIAITRNSTEGMNIVANSLCLKKGDEVILSKDEHIGGAAPWLALSKEMGIKIKLVELDYSGNKNFENIENSISRKTKVVCISHVTCTTGMILPVKEIVELCKRRNIISCIDGAQAVGMIPVDVKSINPDFYITCGHKWLFGPKGSGVLVMNRAFLTKNRPHFVGAYSDSKFDLGTKTIEYLNIASREEYGTRNIPHIIGLGTAVDFISDLGIERIAKRGRELSIRFTKGISNISGIEIFTPKNQEYYCSLVTFKIKTKDNLQISRDLINKNGIRVRFIYENDIRGLRASFAIFNNEEEVDLLIAAIKDAAII